MQFGADQGGNMSKKLGRPVGSTKADARRHRLTILLNALELATIRARAESAGESMSDYARKAAIGRVL